MRFRTADPADGDQTLTGRGTERRIRSTRETAIRALDRRAQGTSDMLYMVIEHFNEGAAPEIYRRARLRGRQLPSGLEYVDSWVDLDYSRCFQLMRTEDPSLFDAWVRAWSDLVRFEIVPVRTSAEAAEVIAGDV